MHLRALLCRSVEFTCPRCGQSMSHDYYGPCTGCRDEMRIALTRARVEVKVAEYEPKMNVTPNAVAQRDD